MSWSLEEAAAYFKNQGAPNDQTALIGLLREIQNENGSSIPHAAITYVAEVYGIKEAFLLAIIHRIPSLRLANIHYLELCAGPNCSKHTQLAACAESLLKAGGFTLKFVPCMRMCAKGPNIKWDGKLYHQADETLLRSLVEKKTP